MYTLTVGIVNECIAKQIACCGMDKMIILYTHIQKDTAAMCNMQVTC